MKYRAEFWTGLNQIALRLPTLVLAAMLVPGARAQEARFFRIAGPARTAIISLSPDGMMTWTNAATGVACTVQTATKLSEGDWTDYVRVLVSSPLMTLQVFDSAAPAGMRLVPAGSFTMGDTFSEGYDDEKPSHSVYLSAFYMDQYEVTKGLWVQVKTWSATNGYSFAGSGKATSHPVQAVSWYDAVRWCNARSQMEGLTPCYYTNAGLTTTYKSGQVNPYVNWNANGYRLPTEAEWEKAARGGASGCRFPWSDTNSISHSRANYYAENPDPYDLSFPAGYHPTFATGGTPYTSPAGYFAANVYGLYDMAGNVWEWCWDWYQDDWYGKAGATQSNTHGPAGPLTYRVKRGGSWGTYAFFCRTAYRDYYYPTYGDGDDGFRCVRAP
jgi:formylglycine-generating enzyme